MNKPPLQELAEKQLHTMPEEIQKLFDSEELGKEIESIAEKNKLTEDQTDLLFDEIAYVLFGITPISSFKKEILTELGISDKIALSISGDTYEMIFNPVKRFIKDSTPSTGLVHKEILSEIENPTPSIAASTQNHTSVKTPSNNMPAKMAEMAGSKQGSTMSKAPSLQDAVGEVPELGGFKPIDSANPAERIANKLDQKLNGPTSSGPKEIYQIKKVDPYHESV